MSRLLNILEFCRPQLSGIWNYGRERYYIMETGNCYHSRLSAPLTQLVAGQVTACGKRLRDVCAVRRAESRETRFEPMNPGSTRMHSSHKDQLLSVPETRKPMEQPFPVWAPQLTQSHGCIFQPWLGQPFTMRVLQLIQSYAACIFFNVSPPTHYTPVTVSSLVLGRTLVQQLMRTGRPFGEVQLLSELEAQWVIASLHCCPFPPSFVCPRRAASALQVGR